jgi:hypothetical protein
VRAHRAVMQGKKPLWVYNACEYTFPSFGAIADYSGMDHYCVWAPKCNINFPLFYWDRIEFAGYYTEAIKRAAEPRPIWNWTQAIDNVEQIGEWQIRCNTPDEIRSQWQQVIGRGVKGILWFIFNADEDANCPEEPKAEMARLRSELDQVADILLEGDPAPAGTLASCADAQVDVAAIQSPYGMAIVLTNLDYDLNLIAPYFWREKTDVVIEVTPLGGFEPASFTMLDGDAQTPLAWQKIADHRWRFTVPSMMSGVTVLVTPEP